MNDLSSPRTPLFNGWRIAGWGSLLALLMLPALAMQMTGEVNWTAGDFVFAAILLGFIGTVVELAARFARPGAPRIGYLIAGFTAFFTFWSNAAVGIIGDEDSVNVFFFLMVAGGPFLARWPSGSGRQRCDGSRCCWRSVNIPLVLPRSG